MNKREKKELQNEILSRENIERMKQVVNKYDYKIVAPTWIAAFYDMKDHWEWRIWHKKFHSHGGVDISDRLTAKEAKGIAKALVRSLLKQVRQAQKETKPKGITKKALF